MTDGERLSETASLYQTVSTILTSGLSGKVTVIPRDPRRFFIAFFPLTNAAQLGIYPGAVPAGTVAGNALQGNVQFKYHDCPGVVTGEWFIVQSGGTGATLMVTDTYIGE